MKRILLLPSILLAILIAPLAGHAANPSFADLSNGPVYLGPIIQSATTSNTMGVVSAAALTVSNSLYIGTNSLSSSNSVQIDTPQLAKALQVDMNGNAYFGGLVGPMAQSPSTSNSLGVVSFAGFLPLSLANLLIAFTAGSCYQPISIKRDQNGLMTNATVLWPDGTFGSYNSTSNNPAWITVDSFTVTYTNAGKTVTQPAVLRDQTGSVTNKPALVVTP